MSYVGLCVIFRDNKETMPLLLKSIEGCFDHYCFTDTGSEDGTRALVEDFLKTRKGLVNDFTWIDDFGAARHFNFEASPARFKMFLDADDVLVNGDKLRAMLMQLEAKEPQLEALFFPYEYGHLETLQTMRCVRWRPGWSWRDAIHERLEFSYPDGESLPEGAFGRVSEIVVKHKDKNPEEKKAAIRRNAVIAQREYEKATDQKYRARLARTLAMEAKMDNLAAKAIPYLEELYRDYRTYPEGRQAAADIAKSYLHLSEVEKLEGALDKALEWAKRGGPAYEALIHHARGEYPDALRAAQRSAGMGPQTTHEGYIFEQGAAYVAAAASAGQLKLGEDVVERLINYIPGELRNDATLMEHVNALRGAIDRITILVPGTPQPFDENGGGGMLGGSEEAVMYLSRALAESGRAVRIYGILPPHRLPGKDRFGVDWQDAKNFDPDNENGTLVLWRAPGILLNLMRAASAKGKPFAGILQAFLWLHDSGLGVPPETVPALAQCAGTVVLSDFHERMLRRQGFTGKTIKLSNGIVEADFEPYVDSPEFDLLPSGDFNGDYLEKGQRDPMSVVYSSCPSRGLSQLLTMWPAVKEAVPEAKLDIYYDWSMLEQMQPRKYDEMLRQYESVRHLDVKHHGGVDHATLHDALRKANIWAYAHFESPEVETSCVSLMKAVAAGATALTVPNGALPETGAGLAHFEKDVEAYGAALIAYLLNPQSVSLRRERAHEMLKRYGWKSVAARFSRLWSIRSDRTESGLVASEPVATSV